MSTNYMKLLQGDRIVIPKLEIADSLINRTFGLMGRDGLQNDYGMWFEPCAGIHTFGMSFPLDVLFLNSDGVAIKAVSNLQPWRICGSFFRARVVIELAAGSIALHNIKVGKRYHYAN